MSNRKVYHVTPGPKGGWQVKAEKASRASSIEDTKDKAVEKAKELAKSSSEGQVVIHKKDGTIQTEHTYGSDPFPPKG